MVHSSATTAYCEQHTLMCSKRNAKACEISSLHYMKNYMYNFMLAFIRESVRVEG